MPFRRGDGYDQGRTRRPGRRHRAPLEITDGRGAHAVLQAIMDALQAGEPVNCGRLAVPPAPPPAPGRTEPRTGETVQIPQNCPTFTAGKAFRNRCNPAPQPGEPREGHAAERGWSSPHRCHACSGGPPSWATLAPCSACHKVNGVPWPHQCSGSEACHASPDTACRAGGRRLLPPVGPGAWASLPRDGVLTTPSPDSGRLYIARSQRRLCSCHSMMAGREGTRRRR